MLSINSVRKIVLPILSIVVVLILLAAYILKTASFTRQVLNKDKKIADLNVKLVILEEVITNSNVGTLLPNEDFEEDGNHDKDFPFIKYVPEGIFTDDEKEQLQEKLVEPFFDFYHEEEISYIAFIIEKLISADDEGDYRFDIQTLDKNGNYGGFLYGEGKKLEWWLPDCLDGCEFSEKFEEEYPEIIEEYNKYN